MLRAGESIRRVESASSILSIRMGFYVSVVIIILDIADSQLFPD